MGILRSRPVCAAAKPWITLRRGKQCLRIVKAIRQPGTLRELLMVIRRFSVWKAKTGSLLLPEWERRGSRNRLLEGATGGNGIDYSGTDNFRGGFFELEVESAEPSFQPLAAPGACLGG